MVLLRDPQPGAWVVGSVLTMTMRFSVRILMACCLLFGAGSSLRAMEHVTLRNGFELDCERRETAGERVRLYLSASVGGTGVDAGANYVEVASDAVVRVEALPEPMTRPVAAGAVRGGSRATPSAADLHQMLAHAGVQHRVDEDLLASVVRAESGGRVAAVSRAGARGLMQLMPATAAAMGVKDAFVAEQNIDGGSAYLDWLLTRYHDDMAIALAAYNAGPAAVDRWHGVPPYRETRAYVARVIREFNRRKLAETSAAR